MRRARSARAQQSRQYRTQSPLRYTIKHRRGSPIATIVFDYNPTHHEEWTPVATLSIALEEMRLRFTVHEVDYTALEALSYFTSNAVRVPVHVSRRR